MAKYKDMNTHPNPAIEDPFVDAGYIDKMFTLSVGPLRIQLSEEEKYATVKTWDMLEAGINLETGEKF